MVDQTQVVIVVPVAVAVALVGVVGWWVRHRR